LGVCPLSSSSTSSCGNVVDDRPFHRVLPCFAVEVHKYAVFIMPHVGVSDHRPDMVFIVAEIQSRSCLGNCADVWSLVLVSKMCIKINLPSDKSKRRPAQATNFCAFGSQTSIPVTPEVHRLVLTCLEQTPPSSRLYSDVRHMFEVPTQRPCTSHHKVK
jgi:hypothetical protein